MRVGPDAGGANQGRPVPLASVLSSLLHRTIRGNEVGSVHFEPQKTGKALEQLSQIPARGLPLHRYRNRKAVILDQND